LHERDERLAVELLEHGAVVRSSVIGGLLSRFAASDSRPLRGWLAASQLLGGWQRGGLSRGGRLL
jgi:hypothetical protein